MIPFEMSCMFLFEKVGTLYGESGGTPLHQKNSLQTDLYMTREDHVFVANVVVTYLMQETVALNVITQLISATTKLNTIAKICKYRGLH